MRGIYTDLALRMAFDAGMPQKPISPFLRVSGDHFVYRGRPVKPVGFNYYWAAETDWTDTSLRATLDDWSTSNTNCPMMLRFWCMQSHSIVGGVRNWTAIDRVLDACAYLGMLAVPTLGNFWADFDYHQKDITWFQANGGYATETPSGALTTYKQYVTEFAARYKGRPEIGIIQLMNEPDGRNADNSCPSEANARDALISFTQDMCAVVRAQDPNHLVMVGCQGMGQCGMRDTSWKSVMQATGNQVAEYHDYYADNVPMGGDATNGQQRHINDALAIPMPVLVGECGADRGDNSAGALNTRRDNLHAKIAAQLGAGADGFLVWDWWNVAHDGAEDEPYNVITGDPLITLLQGGG